MNIFEVTSKVFYHITLKKNVSSILKYGLIATKGERSRQLEDKPANYMFYDLADAEDALMNWLGDELDETEDLALLEITLPENFPVYHDSTANYEYYTTKNIPPEYIKVSNKLNLNEVASFNKDLITDIKGSYKVPSTKRGDEKLSALKSKLSEKGWTIAGQGYYSIVFISPNKQNVLKVNRVRDPAYDHFVEVVKSHPNKHFPKITDKMNIGNGWYAYLMERLYPFSFKDVKQYVTIHKGITALNIIKNDIVELSPDSLYAMALSRLKNDPALYKAATIIIDNKNQYRTDISVENIMQRKDGTLVFSDVYAK
jgi:hypothetical protein